MFNDLKLCQSINRGFDEGVQSLASEICCSILRHSYFTANYLTSVHDAKIYVQISFHFILGQI